MTSDWTNLANIYAKMGAPMLPSPPDVDRVNQLIAGQNQNVLMLGATPQYERLGARLTALDGTAKMIDEYWSQAGDNRRAILGDWLSMPFSDGEFTAIIGDGSFTSAADGLPRLFPEARRVLTPGGVLAVRCFCAPEPPETVSDIVDGLAAPDANPLCFRMRMAMAMAALQPNYVFPISELALMFDRLFPDRKALADKTGWRRDEIDRIDSMKSATYSVGFPPRSWLGEMAAQTFTRVEFLESDGYALAELCPVLVLE